MASGKDLYRCRCGSEDLDIDFDGIATCRRCGASFAAVGGISKFKILPECDEENFTRRAWIRLATKDAPAEAFEDGVMESGRMEYVAVTDSAEVRMPFRVAVGYDRQEAYYETVTKQEYEYVPSRNRYEYVTKKEQELRYRTVTDWKPYSSVHEESSSVTLLNGREIFSSLSLGSFEGDEESFGLGFEEEKADPSLIFFDELLFSDALSKARGSSIAAPSEHEAERMKPDAGALGAARRFHEETAVKSMKAAIPGDRYRNLNYTYRTTQSCIQLFLVPEYYAAVSLDDAKTVVKCLPFGNKPLCGGDMENRDGLAAHRSAEIKKLKDESKEVREVHSKARWEAERKLLAAALAMLAFTFLGMAAVDIASLVSGYKTSYLSLLTLGIVFFALFVAAAIASIFFAAAIWRKDKESRSKEQESMSEIESAANAEICEYARSYKKAVLERLNRKMDSLGLKPASEEDISGLDELALPFNEREIGASKKRNSFDKKILAMKIADAALFVLGIAAAAAVAAFVFVLW